MLVKFKLENQARVPTLAEPGSVGYDLFSNQDLIIPARSRVLVKTGVKMEITDNDIEAQVRPRSGLALKHGITVLNSPGTIDPSYRGEVGVILINHSDDDFEVKRYDRIAQLVFNRVVRPEMEIVEQLSDSQRGEGGFGSSG